MNKAKVFSVVIVLVLGTISTSCQREKDLLNSETERQLYSVCISAVKESSETRALSLSGNVLAATWSAGDKVSVTSFGTSRGTLTAQSSGTRTSFKGELSGSFSVGSELTLTYLGQDYRNQVGSLDYIANNCDCAIATVTITSVADGAITTTAASFVNQQAITQFSFVDENGASLILSNLTISANGGKLVQYSDGTGVHYGDITVRGVWEKKTVALRNELGTRDTYTFTGTVGPISYTGTKKANLENGQYYMTTVTLKPSSYEEPEAIDMGVSVLWASANVGATNPEEFGYYFAWGEVSPKGAYSWENYKWNNGYSSTPMSDSFLKYGSNGADHSFDGKFFLDTEDDAASYLMGEEWHTPSKEEWDELKSRCVYSEVTQNGIKGIKFTSQTTGKSIFLPYAGVKYEESYSGYYTSSEIRPEGYYWTRQLASVLTNGVGTNGLEKTLVQGLVLDWYYGMNRSRFHGLPVRAVKGNIAPYQLSAPENLVVKKGTTVPLFVKIIPENTTNKNVIWSSSNTSVATIINGSVKGVSAGTAVLTATIEGETGLSVSTSVSVITDPNKVDLGLSVYWASWDLGARAMGSKGACYRWGETQPAFGNYNLYYNSGDYHTSLYSKYCLDSSYGYLGYTDNKTVLDAEDDAAHSVLGASWRTPSIEEWEELFNNCNWSETTMNGVEGYKVSKRNSSAIYIFIPKFLYDESDEEYGYIPYMSSSLSSTNYTPSFEPRGSRHNLANYYRTEGFFIRPVYPK